MSADLPGAPRKRGLGMGLSALLGNDADALATPPPGAASRVPIEFLEPSPLQPRRTFAEEELEALTDSIRSRGVMQPLLVRAAAEDPTRYEIIAGERRWRAAQRAGLHELPVVLYALSDRETLEVALLENVQRQDLSPIEEAEGYRRLINEFGHTQAELAETIGKSRSHIANLMRLLELPDPVRRMLDAGDLTAGHARALLMATDPLALARAVLSDSLNVRQTEALVQADKNPRVRSGKSAEKGADVHDLERDLSLLTGLKVTLKPAGTGGTLMISYRTLEQLDGVVAKLRADAGPQNASDDGMSAGKGLT